MESTVRPLRVLFVCTGNSARSIMAEAILRSDGGSRFEAFSAGSHPAGRVSAIAIETLQKRGYAVSHLRSKSWGEFESDEAPPMDVVVTVCDGAACEPCPAWPGRPLLAHWSVPDPVALGGSEHERREAFAQAFGLLRARIGRLVALPVETLDRASLETTLAEIARAG